MERVQSAWFQDPGNKIIELPELSVFFGTLRKILQCVRSSAKPFPGWPPGTEFASWDSLSWPGHYHFLRTHQHCCEPFRQPDATVIVLNRTPAAGARSCAIPSAMPPAGERQSARNRTCIHRPITQTQARGSHAPAGRNTPNSISSFQFSIMTGNCSDRSFLYCRYKGQRVSASTGNRAVPAVIEFGSPRSFASISGISKTARFC